MPTLDMPMDASFLIGSTATERRAAVQHQEEERAAVRDARLAAQMSPLKDPQERIRIWEELHALNLPRRAGHQLLYVIAEQTNLTIEQVHDEQERRAHFFMRPPIGQLSVR